MGRYKTLFSDGEPVFTWLYLSLQTPSGRVQQMGIEPPGELMIRFIIGGRGRRGAWEQKV